jgi:hypothetical protein
MGKLKKKLSKLLSSSKKSARKTLKRLSSAKMSKGTKKVALATLALGALFGGEIGYNSLKRSAFRDGCVNGAAFTMAGMFGPAVIENKEELFGSFCDSGVEAYMEGKLK